MENIILSLNVVLPLFLTVSLGYFIKRIKLIDEHTLKVMNNVTFKIFLPTLLFYNVYKTNLDGALNIKLMIFAPCSIIISCIFMCIIIPLIEKENKRRGVLIQTIFRSNFVLFGIPVVVSLFGDNAVGITSLLIAVVVPTFNFLAVIVLELFRGGSINIKAIIIGIIKNPLIISSALGLLALLINIKLPNFIESAMQDVSQIATPLALIILGGSFEFSRLKGNIRNILIGVFGRLVLIPSIFIPISIVMGFRDIELASVLIMFSAPTAVSSFTMAEQMDADSELAGQLVVFTTAISIVTIFLWILLIKELGYF